LLEIAAFLTSIVSATFGMAGGMMLMGAYTAVLPVPDAMVLHGVTQAVANGSRALLLYKHVRLRVVAFYVIGAVMAYILGRIAAPSLSGPAVWLALGVLPFVSRLIALRFRFDVLDPRLSVLCGFLVNGVQLIAGIGGPLLDLFFLDTTLDRRGVVATKAATQTLSHLVKIAFFAGMARPEPYTAAGCVAAALAGTWLGGRVLERMEDTTFRRWTQTLVLVLGAGYLVAGIVGLARQ
jgi:uncharacterized membrane protein YfcA